MKRTIALTALALTVATGASAMATSADLGTIDRYAGGSDVSVLTSGQVKTLVNVISGGDSEGEKRRYVQWIIEKNGG